MSWVIFKENQFLSWRLSEGFFLIWYFISYLTQTNKTIGDPFDPFIASAVSSPRNWRLAIKKVSRICDSFVLRDNFVQRWRKPITYPHQLFEQVPEHRVRNSICLWLYLLVVVFSLLFLENVWLQETLHILGHQPAPKQCKIVVLKEHILPP